MAGFKSLRKALKGKGDMGSEKDYMDQVKKRKKKAQAMRKKAK